MTRKRKRDMKEDDEERPTSSSKITTVGHENPSTSNTIITESKEEKTSGTSNIIIPTQSNLHPLLIDNIVERICDSLDFSNLKNSRLISKLWKTEATKKMLARMYINIPFNPDNNNNTNNNLKPVVKQLLSHMCSDYVKSTINLHIKNLQQFEYLRKILTTLKANNPNSVHFFDRVHHLKYSGESTEELSKILHRLLNLEFLDTSCLHLRSTNSHRNLFQDRRQLELDIKLLDKLATLKKINFNYILTPSLLRKYSVSENIPKLQALNSFSIGGSKYEIQEILMEYIQSIQSSWAITALNLYSFGVLQNTPLTRVFLSMISETLKILTLRMPSYSDYDRQQESTDIWVDDWLIPLSLKNLESLEIGCYYQGDEGILSRTLAAALQLPKLKKLSIRTGPGSKLDKVITKLNEAEPKPCSSNNDGDNAESHDVDVNSSIIGTQTRPRILLQSTSLRELSIYNNKARIDQSTFFSHSLWPNLTSLQIKAEGLDEGRPFLNQSIFCSIFSDYAGSLERLELDVRVDLESNVLPSNYNHDSNNSTNRQQILSPIEIVWSNGKEPWNFDNLLLGKNGQKNLEEPKNPSILNLKKLKCLKITSVCPLDLCLTDLSIYEAFTHMQSVQSLDIQGQNFSLAAIQDLKAALGPNVCVKISTLKLSRE